MSEEEINEQIANNKKESPYYFDIIKAGDIPSRSETKSMQQCEEETLRLMKFRNKKFTPTRT